MANLFKKYTLAAGALGLLGTALFSTALAKPAERIPVSTDGGVSCMGLDCPVSSTGDQRRIPLANATDKKSQGTASKESLPDTVTINGQKYQQVRAVRPIRR